MKLGHVLAGMVERRVLVRIVGVSWLVLIVTGVWLVRNFTPETVAATDLESLRGRDWTRWVIGWAHVIATATLLLSTLASMRAEYVARRFRQGRVVGALFVVALIGAVLGQLIPWEQMALWSLTAGTTLTGLTPIFGDNVRFVLLGGSEVSGDELGVLYLIHSVAVPAVALLLVAIGGVIIARNPATTDSDS